MKIITTDLKKVQYLVPERPALLITIKTPERGVWPPHPERRWNSILRLEFFDDYGHNDKSFVPEHAELIKKSVEERDWAVICIQCEAGLSRSPAIASALRRFYKIEGGKQYNAFSNCYVYYTLLEFLSKHPLIRPEDTCNVCGREFGEHGIRFPMIVQELKRINCKIPLLRREDSGGDK